MPTPGSKNSKIITKDTMLCVSIAEHPSNFGTTLFNAAFEHEGIDAIYKALQVQPGNAKDAVAGIRALGIRGCGVSMPFKQEVIKYLDSVEEKAEQIGAVNTIVNTGRGLRGYNTDYSGAKTVLEQLGSIRSKKIVLLGAGGVARAISAALHSLHGHNVVVAAREEGPGQELVRKWKLAAFVLWKQRNDLAGDLLINATPVGMAPLRHAMPVEESTIERFRIVMDVVINPLETKLMKVARQKRKAVLPGYRMSLHQAARQFKLYTGRKAPLQLMEEQIKKVYNPLKV